MANLVTATNVLAGATPANAVYAGSSLVWTRAGGASTGPRNTFMGITSGTAVTTGNSGGTSGDAFASVTGTMVCQSSADLTTAYDRGVVATLASSSASYVSWSVGTSTKGYIRAYVRLPSLPTATLRPLRGVSGATVKWEVRISTTGQIITGRQDGGSLQQSAVGAISPGVIYRFEMGVDGTTSDLRVYAGESTSSPIAMTNLSSYDSGSWDAVRFGAMTSSAISIAVDLAAFGYSPDGFIGPA